MDNDPPPVTPPDPERPGAWVEVPTPLASPKRRSTGLLVAVVALVVAGLVAIVVVTRGGGPTIPDEVAGQPRITAGPTVEVLDAIGDLEVDGVSMDVAIYGTELAPAYMVMIVSGDIGGDAGDMLGTLPEGVFSDRNVSVDFSSSIRATVDGVGYVCAPAVGADLGTEVTMCLFAGGDLGGIVMSLTPAAVQGLMATTQRLVDEIG